MLALRILLLGILLLVIPVIVGSLFAGVDKRMKKLPFLWISGQMLLWAGFQVITVPLILKQERFTLVVQIYLKYMAVLVAAALVFCVIRKKRGGASLRPVDNRPGARKKGYYAAWAVFWGLLIFQLVQALRLAYADGDDAFYVAVATVTEESDTMYIKSAYTGGTTTLDARYGLAPFPIWIAFLARVTGIRTASVAHMAAPPILIAMTYGIYYLLGNRLLVKNKERLPLFLIFTELLVLFGDYSIYTAERFMIERSRQGKAALASIVIPLLILLLFLLLEKLQENKKVPVSYWVLLLCTLTTACLCSTLGTLLTCMLIAVTGVCGAFCYKKWKFLFPLAACCLPCVVFSILYVLL